MAGLMPRQENRRSRRCIQHGATLLLALGFSVLSVVAIAQSPGGPAFGGILIGDLTLDQVLLSRDLDGDGTADAPDEVSVFFDETNASGLPSPTGGVFTVHQALSGYTYVGDGNTDSVYRLEDANHDGDANDDGEATVWFSEAENASAFTLPTPNGLHEFDGALYIVNAGVSSRPNDVVYRTQDLNGDGDANDAGEAVVWLDLGTLASDLLGYDPNRSSAFDITFIGDRAYIADTLGGEPDSVFVARDRNKNGVIDSRELKVFVDDTNPFGVPVATGMIAQGDSILVAESSRSAEQTIFRLKDRDKSGAIDDESEVELIWDESQIPPDVELGTSFGITVTFEDEVYLTSGGSDLQDNVFRLVDLDGDGRYLSTGETIAWRRGNGSRVAVDFARSLASIHEFLAAQGYYAVSNVNDHNDLPKDVGDISAILADIDRGMTPDYSAIGVIYGQGKNSIKPDGSIRTLKGFADGVDSKDPNKNFDALFPEAVRYFRRPDFLDAYLSDAIAGTGEFESASDAARAAAISNGLLATLSYWVRFELRFSEVKAGAGNFACPKGAPHNWDEGFAFYYGARGQDSLFAFATELEDYFDVAKRGVNAEVIKAFSRGIDRLVPDRPALGDVECPALSKRPRYPNRRAAQIEAELERLFLLGLLRAADDIVAGGGVAQIEAQGLYLAVAPEVKARSKFLDRKLRRLLRVEPKVFVGRAINRLIEWFYRDALGI
ncbi:MAG: hypothetical protein AAF493_12765 [Pseudomonadota bacterium]